MRSRVCPVAWQGQLDVWGSARPPLFSTWPYHTIESVQGSKGRWQKTPVFLKDEPQTGIASFLLCSIGENITDQPRFKERRNQLHFSLERVPKIFQPSFFYHNHLCCLHGIKGKDCFLGPRCKTATFILMACYPSVTPNFVSPFSWVTKTYAQER